MPKAFTQSSLHEMVSLITLKAGVPLIAKRCRRLSHELPIATSECPMTICPYLYGRFNYAPRWMLVGAGWVLKGCLPRMAFLETLTFILT